MKIEKDGQVYEYTWTEEGAMFVPTDEPMVEQYAYAVWYDNGSGWYELLDSCVIACTARDAILVASHRHSTTEGGLIVTDGSDPNKKENQS